MSFADYTSLQTSIGSWMHRSDLGTVAPDLITLFEADFNNDSSNHCRQMEQETSITATSGYLITPTDWLAWRQIKGTNNGIDFQVPTSPLEISTDRTAGESNSPSRYAVVVGSKTYLKPSIAGTFATVYVSQLPALSSSNTSNWLLAKYPNLYLWGSLAFAASFQSDQLVTLWKQHYQDALGNFRRDIRRSRFGTVPTMLPDQIA